MLPLVMDAITVSLYSIQVVQVIWDRAHLYPVPRFANVSGLLDFFSQQAVSLILEVLRSFFGCAFTGIQ